MWQTSADARSGPGRIQRRLRSAFSAMLLAHAALAADPDRAAAQNDPHPVRADMLRAQPSGPAQPAPSPVPAVEKLRAAEIPADLLALVARLDHEDFEERERLVHALIEWPGEDLAFYALLNRTGEEALTIEQRRRLLIALRERYITGAGGALGIALQPMRVAGAVEHVQIEVTDLLPDLPAAEVLRVGDRIIAMEGQPFESGDALVTRVQMRQPGDSVVLTVLRRAAEGAGGEVGNQPVVTQLDVPITLGSTSRLIDPETGRPQLAPALIAQRRKAWELVEARFQGRPSVIELNGELAWDAPIRRRVRRSQVFRPAEPERPELNDELFAAITNDDEDQAIELVEQGASVNARNASDLPVLFLASAGCIDCRGAMPRLTEVLLEHGAEVDATIANGLQAIHFVARAGSSNRPNTRETLDLLIKYGADINTQSSAGTRPITFAIQLGNDEWRDFLVSRGAAIE